MNLIRNYLNFRNFNNSKFIKQISLRSSLKKYILYCKWNKLKKEIAWLKLQTFTDLQICGWEPLNFFNFLIFSFSVILVSTSMASRRSNRPDSAPVIRSTSYSSLVTYIKDTLIKSNAMLNFEFKSIGIFILLFVGLNHRGLFFILINKPFHKYFQCKKW